MKIRNFVYSTAVRNFCFIACASSVPSRPGAVAAQLPDQEHAGQAYKVNTNNDISIMSARLIRDNFWRSSTRSERLSGPVLVNWEIPHLLAHLNIHRLIARKRKGAHSLRLLTQYSIAVFAAICTLLFDRTSPCVGKWNLRGFLYEENQTNKSKCLAAKIASFPQYLPRYISNENCFGFPHNLRKHEVHPFKRERSATEEHSRQDHSRCG